MHGSAIKISYSLRVLSGPLTTSEMAYRYFIKIWNRRLLQVQEQVYVIYLNQSSEVIGWNDIAKGSTHSVEADIKLLVAVGLQCLAARIIIAHNHPGGTINPSQDDIIFTQKLNEACRLFDIKLADHLVLSRHGFYSMRDHRLL